MVVFLWGGWVVLLLLLYHLSVFFESFGESAGFAWGLACLGDSCGGFPAVWRGGASADLGVAEFVDSPYVSFVFGNAEKDEHEAGAEDECDDGAHYPASPP
jgi:hypothetical protein